MARRANQEGSIYQRSRDGLWVAAIQLEDGRRRVFYGRTQADALRKKNEAMEKVSKGLPLSPERLTLGRWLDKWLHEIVEPDARPKTFRSYDQLVRLHLEPGLGRIRLGKLQPSDIRTFQNIKLRSGLSPRTVHHLHAVLHTALAAAERDGLVGRNVARLVAPPAVEQYEAKPFDPQETRVFLRACNGHRLGGLFTVAAACGLREGECLGLRWEDTDLDAGVLHVRQQIQRAKDGWVTAPPKSRKSRRTLALPAVALQALKDHRTRQLEMRLKAGVLWDSSWGLVFCTATGTPLNARNVVRDFNKLLKDAELRHIRFHDRRHGFASLLAASGSSLRMAQELLGHSQISITSDLYTHIFEPVQREAMTRLDDVLAAT